MTKRRGIDWGKDATGQQNWAAYRAAQLQELVEAVGTRRLAEGLEFPEPGSN